MTEPAVLTVQEAAGLLRVSHWTVGSMVRDGRLPRVPGLRRIRIPVRAVQALLEGYDVRDESDWPPPAKAPAPRRRQRNQADGPLASQAVGSGDPLHRPIGPKAGDVVVRVVEGRSR